LIRLQQPKMPKLKSSFFSKKFGFTKYFEKKCWNVEFAFFSALGPQRYINVSMWLGRNRCSTVNTECLMLRRRFITNDGTNRNKLVDFYSVFFHFQSFFFVVVDLLFLLILVILENKSLKLKTQNNNMANKNGFRQVSRQQQDKFRYKLFSPPFLLHFLLPFFGRLFSADFFWPTFFGLLFGVLF